MTQLESTVDFKETIEEIEILIKYAIRNKNNLKKYALFNKAAIVLLCAKFESFFENCLTEYVDRQLKNSKGNGMDPYIYNHIIDKILDKLVPGRNDNSKKKKYIEMLGSLVNADIDHNSFEFPINVKFNPGRHGQKEVERILKTFGFTELVEKLKQCNFFGSFNSLINIRHNIIHEDATPSLTHQDVQGHANVLINFVNALDEQCRKILCSE